MTEKHEISEVRNIRKSDGFVRQSYCTCGSVLFTSATLAEAASTQVSGQDRRSLEHHIARESIPANVRERFTRLTADAPLTDDIKKFIAAELTTKKFFSFPNGSAYHQQYIVDAPFDITPIETSRGTVYIESVYGRGTYLLIAGRMYCVGHAWVKRGPGASFGVHYNTRDLYLDDLQID